MQFGGFLPFSLLDFPNTISAVLFTQGCNFHCPYCHNPSLISTKPKNTISEEHIINFLKSRKGKLQGVVITGGEPTLHPQLLPFLLKIKQLGYAIKLDTNGSCPNIIQQIIAENIVTYWAIDRKASVQKYAMTTRSHIPPEHILTSTDLISHSGTPYECRTTVVPSLHSFEEIQTIAQEIAGAPLYFLQRFNPEHALDPSFRTLKPYSPQEMDLLCTLCRPYVKTCLWR